MKRRLLLLIVVWSATVLWVMSLHAADKPNVLFIAIGDLYLARP